VLEDKDKDREFWRTKGKEAYFASVILKSQKLLNEKYEKQSIKLGWHGNNSLTSQDGRYKITVEGGFFSYLSVSDTKDDVKYPVHASAGAHFAGGSEDKVQCVNPPDNSHSPICVKRVIWHDGGVAIIIVSKTWLGRQDYLFDIPYKALKQENLPQLKQEYTRIARKLFNIDGYLPKVGGGKGMVLWSAPWGRTCPESCANQCSESFKKLIPPAYGAEKKFKPLAYFLLAERIGDMAAADYYKMIRLAVEISESIGGVKGHEGPEFYTSPEFFQSIPQQVDVLVTGYIKTLRGQIPKGESLKYAKALVKNKKLKNALKGNTQYKLLKSDLKATKTK
jgi:hypothetical protein